MYVVALSKAISPTGMMHLLNTTAYDHSQPHDLTAPISANRSNTPTYLTVVKVEKSLLQIANTAMNQLGALSACT
jgi:hypothetical protein